MSESSQTGIWALIPAAGIGSRMTADRPKQYLELAGSTILEHTLRAVSAYAPLKGILVGIAADDQWWPQVESRLGDLGCALIPFAGGKERADTVFMGLQEIIQRGGTGDRVLVHDAVRPLVRPEDIALLVDRVGDDQDGGLLAVPVADTLKSEQDGRAIKTVDRSHLWRALTPQYFPVSRLSDALQRCREQGVVVTDEASAIEQVGGRPGLVSGNTDNIKLTYPSDLQMAELLISRRQS